MMKTVIKTIFPATAAVALLLGGLASHVNAGTKIGVTAAVNKNAKATSLAGRVRPVVLGGNVIFKERIDTSGTGLVQILFTDGSTITVGANASLVIDKYIYNPATGSGKLSVSFGKGVLRFIGGKISKNKGGVTIRTAIGTSGIRGGMANIAISQNKGVFSFLFGKELSFVGLNGEKRRIYQAGYTLLAEKNGANGYSKLIIRRTLEGETDFFQRALAGRGGQNGGLKRGPRGKFVSRSGFSATNSGIPLPRIKPKTLPEVVVATPLDDIESDLLDITNAFPLDFQGPPPVEVVIDPIIEDPVVDDPGDDDKGRYGTEDTAPATPSTSITGPTTTVTGPSGT